MPKEQKGKKRKLREELLRMEKILSELLVEMLLRKIRFHGRLYLDIIITILSTQLLQVAILKSDNSWDG